MYTFTIIWFYNLEAAIHVLWQISVFEPIQNQYFTHTKITLYFFLILYSPNALENQE